MFNNNEKKKIIIVDDDEISLATAELYLQNDYEIHKIKSGSEFFDYLTNNEYIPDLILLDILMPDMTGWDILKKIRAISNLKSVPVVFITSLDNNESKKQAFRMGAADYITKPYNMSFLQKSIKDVFKK
jgi:putative two-component system response regulator